MFTANRLRTLLPRLQRHYRRQQEAEMVAAWKVSFLQAKAKRDSLAKIR